jgi:hypothetical protein
MKRFRQSRQQREKTIGADQRFVFMPPVSSPCRDSRLCGLSILLLIFFFPTASHADNKPTREYP